MVVRTAPDESGGGGGGGSGKDRDWDRRGDDTEEDRAARHTSANTSSVRSGHARNNSGASSTYSSRSGHASPTSWRDAFVRLQTRLGPDPTPVAMKLAMVQFFDSLPPAYYQAAAEFIKLRRETGEPVNLDALGFYFTMLDQSAAEARSISRSTPPLRSSRSPPLRKPSPLSLKAKSYSPTSPRRSRERNDGDHDHHFADFAPSRPHVSNLLLSDVRDDDSRSSCIPAENSRRDSPR